MDGEILEFLLRFMEYSTCFIRQTESIVNFKKCLKTHLIVKHLR